jgi:hypothetical protein
MRLDHKPAYTVPAKTRIVFDESDPKRRGYVVQPEPYKDTLRADIVAWLDAHAPGWKVAFDRGDWGEGTATVTITLPSHAAGLAFQETWNTEGCKQTGPYNCPNMVTTDGLHYACKVCGENLTVHRSART